MEISKTQQCVICKEIFVTSHDLISHFETFHSNHRRFEASGTTTFHQSPNPNIYLNHALPTGRGYLDSQGRFQKGFFPSPTKTPAKENHFLQPNLMDLFPATSSEDIRTLPLLCQLEKPIKEDTLTEYNDANSSSIDLSLRL